MDTTPKRGNRALLYWGEISQRDPRTPLSEGACVAQAKTLRGPRDYRDPVIEPNAHRLT